MKLKRIKREEASERVEARSKRTDKQQLVKLCDSGHGHSREATRLNLNINIQSQEKATKSSKPVKV